MNEDKKEESVPKTSTEGKVEVPERLHALLLKYETKSITIEEVLEMEKLTGNEITRLFEKYPEIGYFIGLYDVSNRVRAYKVFNHIAEPKKNAPTKDEEEQSNDEILEKLHKEQLTKEEKKKKKSWWSRLGSG